MSTKVRAWQKVTAELVGLRENARAKPSPHLEVRLGARKTSFRVNYRQHGIDLRQVIAGENLTLDDWQNASREAESLIYKARFGEGPKEKDLTRSETLCDEIVKLKESKADATYEQAEIFFRLHIKPYLNERYPYAVDLNATVWLNYKNQIRLKDPTVTLFNHWKFFTMLFKYAYQKGILKAPVKLDYDQEKEDFRKPGQIIPDEIFKYILASSNRTWGDRARLGRLTGQRPGVIRKLRKDQVNLDIGVCKVEKSDSKNRRSYSFVMPEQAIEILRARLQLKHVKDSPYFFPMRSDVSRSMDKSLKGWHSAVSRAKEMILEDSAKLASEGQHEESLRKHQLAVAINIDDDAYTPHDLRHSYLTHKFKKTSNPALVCYSCDLSLEEAMETYIHFDAEDTRAIATETAAEASSWLG